MAAARSALGLGSSTFVDLHCHVLPAVDDGPADLPEALELVQGLESLGFKDLYPTPHQKAGIWTPSATACDQAASALRELLAHDGSRVTLHPPAAENMWDELFLSRHAQSTLPCYPGARALLIELRPEILPPHLPEILFQLRLAGRLPVLAHVERYPALLEHPDRLALLGQSTALLVNLSSLGGDEGWRTRRHVRKLVERRLIHATATDSHSTAELPYLQAGMEWICEALGEKALEALLSQNPRRILAGELPEPW